MDGCIDIQMAELVLYVKGTAVKNHFFDSSSTKN
jgi:hypothetical protein